MNCKFLQPVNDKSTCIQRKYFTMKPCTTRSNTYIIFL